MRLRHVPLLVSLVVVTLVGPAAAATPPTVPFDSTADLLVLDDGCLCVVEVAEDGTIAVVVTTAQVVAADPEASGPVDVDFNEAGIAVAADGTAYFGNADTNSILTLAPDGSVDLFLDGSSLGADVELERLAIGPDGTLYANDGDASDVLAIDRTTGTSSVLAARSDFEALPGVTAFELEGGLVVDAAGTLYVTSDSSPNAIFAISPDGTPSLLASEPDEVQSVASRATSGDFTLTFDSETTGPIAFDAPAAQVRAALEGLSNIAPGDVMVRGEGPPMAPWVVTFTGTYAATDVPEMTADGTGLSGGGVDVRTEVTGASFDDLDLWTTFDAGGLIAMTDDNATLFQISPTGEITTLVVGREFLRLAGTDLEGGIAYDEDGTLYLAENSDDTIYSYSDGVLAVAHSRADLEAVTGDSNLQGGIAFRMPIVDIAPIITAPGEAVAGESLTYTVGVTNTGDDTLDGMTLVTGAGLEGVTVTTDSGVLAGTAWTGGLAPGDTVTFTVVGTVPSDLTGALVLRATSTAALGAVDTDTADDAAEVEVDVAAVADLAVTASAPETLPVGGTADLVVTVTNEGPSDAVDVVVTDTLPVGLVAEVVASVDLDCDAADGVVTCSGETLAAGASTTIAVTVTTDELDCTAAGEDAPVECAVDGVVLDSLVNRVTVSATTADPDAGDNEASTTTVLDTSDVEVDLPAAGATTEGLGAAGLTSVLLGLALLRAGRRGPRPATQR